MATYNPYNSASDDYYDPYQNTQDAGQSLGQMLFSTAKSMATFGMLNMAGRAGSKYVSTKAATFIKTYGAGKLAQAARASNAKTLTDVFKQTGPGKTLSSIYTQSTKSFTSALSDKDSYVSQVRRTSGANAGRISGFKSSFKDFRTFAGSVGRLWKDNVWAGAGVAYAIDSFAGVTRDYGIEQKSWYDAPGQIGNFGKWLAMDSVFSMGLGVAGKLAKYAGSSGLSSVKQAYEGPLGPAMYRFMEKVSPRGLPAGVNKSFLKPELKGELDSPQNNFQQHLVNSRLRKSLAVGKTVFGSISTLNTMVGEMANTAMSALKGGKPVIKSLTHEDGPIKSALEQVKQIWKNAADNRREISAASHPGLTALQFTDDLIAKVRTNQPNGKGVNGILNEYTHQFRAQTRARRHKNVIGEVFTDLERVKNKDIVNQQWVDDTTRDFKNRGASQSATDSFMKSLLNMHAGIHMYKPKGKDIAGGGVDLGWTDPLHMGRRLLNFTLNRNISVPFSDIKLNPADLLQTHLLGQSPAFAYFYDNEGFNIGKNARAKTGTLLKDGTISTSEMDENAWFTTYSNDTKSFSVVGPDGIKTVKSTNRLIALAPGSTFKKHQESRMQEAMNAKGLGISDPVDKPRSNLGNKYVDYFIDKAELSLPGVADRLLRRTVSAIKGKKNHEYVDAGKKAFSDNPDDWYKYGDVIHALKEQLGQDLFPLFKNKKFHEVLGGMSGATQFGDSFDVMFNARTLRQRMADVGYDKNSAWLKKRGVAEAAELIKARPSYAAQHKTVKGLGGRTELTAYDQMRIAVVEDTLVSQNNPFLDAARVSKMVDDGIISDKQGKKLTLYSKLLQFTDTGMFDRKHGIRRNTDLEKSVNEVRKHASDQNWNMSVDIANYVKDSRLRSPHLRNKDFASGESSRNTYLKHNSAYVTVGRNPMSFFGSYSENVLNNVTDMLHDTIFPFRKNRTNLSIGGNIGYLSSGIAKIAGTMVASKALDAFVAANPMFNDTAFDAGLAGFVADNAARLRLGQSRVFDAFGITGIAKHLNGLMPGFTTSAPGAIIGSVVSRTLGGGPLGIMKGFGMGAIGNRLLAPYLPDFTKSYEQLESEYQGKIEVPMMKSPTWLLGATPWEGSKVAGYQPNWYVRMKSRWKETDTLYGSTMRKFIHEPIPLVGLSIGDFVDPYYMELKHFFSRPYPETGEWGKEVPLVGPLIAGTLGRIFKPKKTMHQEFLTGSEDLTEDSVYPFSIQPPTVAEGRGMMHHSKNIRSMGSRSTLMGNFVYSSDNKMWAHTAGEDFLETAQNFAGLPGFLAGTAKDKLTNTPMVLPTLETAGRMASMSRDYFDMNLGGMGVFTEPVRRLIDKPDYKRYGINPIPNLMPNWLPSEFLTGDPYCLSGDTLIEVNKNQIKRIDHYDNEPITTHTGSYSIPIAFKSRKMKTDEKLFKIQVSSLASFPIKATEDHPFWTTKGWIKAKDLLIGDYVGYPIPKIENLTINDNIIDLGLYTDKPRDSRYIYSFRGDQEFVDMIEYIETKKSSFDKGELKLVLDLKHWSRKKFERAQVSVKNKITQRVPRFIIPSKEFNSLIGYYLSEGFVLYSNKKQCGLGFAFNVNELEYHNEVESYINNIFNIKTTKKIKENSCVIFASNSVLGSIFSNMFGEGFANKELKNISQQYAKDTLRTLFNGDGSYFFDKDKPRLSLKLENLQLLYQTRKLLLAYGFVGYIVENNLVLRGQAAKDCALFLGIKYKETKDSEFICRHTYIKNGYVWMRVFNKKEIQQEIVYGMEVSEDNSFCTAGVATHNTKIMKGELRLPGKAYQVTHRVRNSMPARASMLGAPEEHQIQYFTGLLPPLLKEEYDILSTGTTVHEKIQDMLAAEGLLIQAEAVVQDVKNDITGHVDAIIRDGQGGRGRKALEIKTINAEAFSKLDAPKNQHVSQLNFYLKQLKMREGVVMYVNRENPAQVKTYNINYSESKWQRDLRKLQKSRQVTSDVMDKGVDDRFGYSYSWLDRLGILADVAPSSPEFKEAKFFVENQIKYGQLSEDDVAKYKKSLSHRQSRLRRYELYPNRFKGKVLSPDSYRNIQSINEDIKSADQYTLPERVIGSIWERFTNSNNFISNKFFAFKDPLEHYKMLQLYGKEYKPWDEVYGSFVEPTMRSMLGQTDPLGGGYKWALPGYVLTGGPIGAAAGGILGAAYGTVNGLFRGANSAYIPGSVQDRREIESYFDAAKYERNQRAADLSQGIAQNEYMKARDSTLIAFNSNGQDVANLFRGTAYMEKPYIEPWLNIQNDKERKEVLKYIPKELGKALKRQWSMEDRSATNIAYNKNSSADIAQGSPRPAFDRSVLDPSVQLEDIKLKTIEEAGLNSHDFGLGWNQQLYRVMDNYNNIRAADMNFEAPNGGSNVNAGQVRQAIVETIRSRGLKGTAQVYINQSADDVNVVNITLRRDRALTIRKALDYREKYYE